MFLIEIKNIFKTYGELQVLKGACASFERGNVSIVLGQSGEGKSVLMKLIVGLETIDNGEIIFDDESISSFSESEFMRIRRKCCYNFQLPALLKAKTVFQNVALPLVWKGKENEGYEEIVYSSLEKVGLQDVCEKQPHELSYGMQKRISIARSLIVNPDYIIFDEPTSGLDPITALKLYDLILQCKEEFKKGVIIVTHDIEGIAYLKGNVNLLKNGKFIFQGPSDDLFRSEDVNVQKFLEG